LNPHDWLLYQDDALLVVNKPAGLPTLPDGYQPAAPYLVSLLQEAFGPLWVVHRLDRETSGVIVLARTADAHRELNRQFRERDVTKVYHALVAGQPTWDACTLDLPLRPDGDRQHRTVVDRAAGKPSITACRVLERLGAYTLIEAQPQTGRPHQIRAHLAAAGLPLVGDALYAGLGGGLQGEAGAALRRLVLDAAPLARLGLHARSLTIAHPITAAAMTFAAPYPADFSEALARLRG
jgi:RluA family pseudouridine synthase